MKYEYKAVHMSKWPDSIHEYIDWLNELGQDGWKVVHLEWNGDYIYFMKETNHVY